MKFHAIPPPRHFAPQGSKMVENMVSFTKSIRLSNHEKREETDLARKHRFYTGRHHKPTDSFFHSDYSGRALPEPLQQRGFVGCREFCGQSRPRRRQHMLDPVESAGRLLHRNVSRRVGRRFPCVRRGRSQRVKLLDSGFLHLFGCAGDGPVGFGHSADAAARPSVGGPAGGLRRSGRLSQNLPRRIDVHRHLQHRRGHSAGGRGLPPSFPDSSGILLHQHRPRSSVCRPPPARSSRGGNRHCHFPMRLGPARLPPHFPVRLELPP